MVVTAQADDALPGDRTRQALSAPLQRIGAPLTQTAQMLHVLVGVLLGQGPDRLVDQRQRGTGLLTGEQDFGEVREGPGGVVRLAMGAESGQRALDVRPGLVQPSEPAQRPAPVTFQQGAAQAGRYSRSSLAR